MTPRAIQHTLAENDTSIFKRLTMLKRIYFVGSGSSYSVALYGALLINQFTEYFAYAMPPREFIELGHENTAVVLISQGGTNVDIIDATKKAVELNCEMIAITASEHSELVEIVGVKNILFLKLFSEEDCFVNSQGVGASFALMLSILDYINSTKLCDRYDYHHLFQQSREQVLQHNYLDPNERHYYALGNGFAKPALHECVLKMSEVVLSECLADDIKNFTHGKHLLPYLMRNTWSFLIYANQENLPLAKSVATSLQSIFDEVHIFISYVPYPWSALSHLFHTFIISQYFCDIKGLSDPINFRPPEALISLYKTRP